MPQDKGVNEQSFPENVVEMRSLLDERTHTLDPSAETRVLWSRCPLL